MKVKFANKEIAEVIRHEDDFSQLLVKPTDIEGDAMLMKLLNQEEKVSAFDNQYLVTGIMDNYLYRLQKAS